MSNLTKKKIPWRQISAIVLILAVIGGIYMMKNAYSFSEDNAAVQNEVTGQITEQVTDNSNQTNTEDNSGPAEASDQPSAAQDSEQTSAADQSSPQTGSSLPKLVDLGSDTCIPCREMAPVLEELKEEYAGKVDVEVVDVYEDQEIAMEYNAIHPLSVIPTQILFDANGNEVWSHEGSLPKEEIITVFKDKVGVE